MPPPVIHEVSEIDPSGPSSAGVADGEPGGDVELGHSVELEAFSGPLDLLLFLVRRAEVDVVDIPIATIADQFVDTVAAWNELDLDIAGEFILMAATLLEIKARLIAPPLEAPMDEDAGEEDVVDLRAGLVGKLLAYRRFKEASLDLLAREDHQRHRHVRQLREEIPDDPEEAEGIDLDNADPYALASAWELVLKRINGLGPRTVINDTVPLESRVIEMLEHMRSSGHAFLKAIFASQPNRIARVTTFMALLECVRQRWIEAIQHGQYADVELRFRAEHERPIHEIAFAPEPEAKRRQRRPPLITWEGAPGSTTGDEDGEAPEEPQESDEQRFLRELEETSRVDSVLAWSADIELGFGRFQAERRGEPWPPPKPEAPEPPPKSDAPAPPSWMAARAPARKPKEREDTNAGDKPAAPAASEGTVPIAAAPEAGAPTVSAPAAPAGPSVPPVVTDPLATVVPVARPMVLVAEPVVIARAEPDPWVPIAAVAIASVHADADTEAVAPTITPAPRPTADAIATDAITVASTDADPVQPAPTITPVPETPADAIAPATGPTAVAQPVEPVPTALTHVTPAAAAAIETTTPEPSPEPLVVREPGPFQAAAFADAVSSVDDAIAIRLDDRPATDEGPAVPAEDPQPVERTLEPATAPRSDVEAVETVDTPTPDVDPVLAEIGDIELDAVIEPPTAAEQPVEPVRETPPPAPVPVTSARLPATALPTVVPATAETEPTRAAAPRTTSATPPVAPARPPAAPSPAPPPPSVRTAARREPSAIVMSTGRPADSRAQMRAAVASRQRRHRAIGMSATLLVIAVGCWIWRASSGGPAIDTEYIGAPGAPEVPEAPGEAPRAGAIPPLIAARGDAIEIDSARLATIPRLAAWTERVRLGGALPDLPSWTSALFTDGAMPAIEEHGFVLAPKRTPATPALPVPVPMPTPAPEAAPAAVELPEPAIPATTANPDQATVAIAPPVRVQAAEPLPAAAAPAVGTMPAPSAILTSGTLVRWPADEPSMVTGHAAGLHGWIDRLRASHHADAFAALLSEGLPTPATIAAPAEALPAFRYERDDMMSSSAWLVVWAWDIAP